jgi:hypothetical protein
MISLTEDSKVRKSFPLKIQQFTDHTIHYQHYNQFIHARQRKTGGAHFSPLLSFLRDFLKKGLAFVDGWGSKNVIETN